MKIIAYTYEADCHCVDCAKKRFELPPLTSLERKDRWPDNNGISAYQRDNEGNEVRPIFSTDEQLEPLHCGDCHESI